MLHIAWITNKIGICLDRCNIHKACYKLFKTSLIPPYFKMEIVYCSKSQHNFLIGRERKKTDSDSNNPRASTDLTPQWVCIRYVTELSKFPASTANRARISTALFIVFECHVTSRSVRLFLFCSFLYFNYLFNYLDLLIMIVELFTVTYSSFVNS